MSDRDPKRCEYPFSACEAAQEVQHLRARVSELETKLAEAEQDKVLAAGALMVPLPEPGTDAARMLIANRLLRRERDEAHEKLAEVDRLPAGYYVFRKKDDGAGAHFDVSLLTDEAAAALGELGVEEAVYSMPFGECMDVLRRVIARETSGERPA